MLDVNGTARVSGNTIIGDGSGDKNIRISGGTGAILYYSNAGSNTFQTATYNWIGNSSYDYAINNLQGGSVFNLYVDGGTNNVLLAPTAGSVGIGTTSPNASALLDVTSTTKGFLPPRMTGAQAEAIGTPAAGLLVYANNGNGTTITSTGWWGYNGTGWVKLN
jgi:hypothetical protein